MSPRRKKNIRRRLDGTRPYKTRFVIVAEGRVTERLYFNCFNRYPEISSKVVVDCVKKGDSTSSPEGVLKTMKKYLKDKNHKMRNTDHAWLVIDKDNWEDTEIAKLHAWCVQENRGFALSNPKFEYWLLLHFEEVKGHISSAQCSHRLANHLPGYDKKVPCRKFTLPKIQEAVRRAQTQDNSRCSDWPRTTGSTVYRLVSSLLELAQIQTD